jgi:hypothetical protein
MAGNFYILNSFWTDRVAAFTAGGVLRMTFFQNLVILFAFFFPFLPEDVILYFLVVVLFSPGRAFIARKKWGYDNVLLPACAALSILGPGI